MKVNTIKEDCYHFVILLLKRLRSEIQSKVKVNGICYYRHE